MATEEHRTGTVVSVNLSDEKGTIKRPVPEIAIDERGISGDAHAGDWHRQVSLLASESIERFAAQMGRQVGPGEFAENITTREVDLNNVALLDRLTVGAAELEVTQIGKECHGDGCAIFREVGRCLMPSDGIFCRVIKGGAVKPNDVVEHFPRPLRIRIITMSDRASRGVYEDRSGPRIGEKLHEFFDGKRWHLTVESTLLPDDAGLLRKELKAARDSGIDAVFTTGGTGVGPRDITPDVVTAMADRTIPGIMEHIRLTFGAEKPNALLSRSVAAVLGFTIVYTLPGSVKGVDEYMGEIVKTLEHLVLTLHEVDTH